MINLIRLLVLIFLFYFSIFVIITVGFGLTVHSWPAIALGIVGMKMAEVILVTKIGKVGA